MTSPSNQNGQTHPDGAPEKPVSNWPQATPPSSTQPTQQPPTPGTRPQDQPTQSVQPPQPGYPQQPGYPPQPVQTSQPVQPPQPGYPQQPGYPPQSAQPPYQNQPAQQFQQQFQPPAQPPYQGQPGYTQWATTQQPFPSQPAKKPRRGPKVVLWLITIVALVVSIALAVMAVTHTGFFAKKEDQTKDASGEVIMVDSESVALVEHPTGATLKVDTGTVPKTREGEIGEMAFAITEEENPPEGELPEGAELVGSTYTFAPEGFNFDQPVTAAIPVPAGENPDDLEVAFLNQYGQWQYHTSRYVPESNSMVFDTWHFSSWSLVKMEVERQTEFGKVKVIAAPSDTKWVPPYAPLANRITNFEENGRHFESFSVCLRPKKLDNEAYKIFFQGACLFQVSNRPPDQPFRSNYEWLISPDTQTAELPAGNYVATYSVWQTGLDWWEWTDSPSYYTYGWHRWMKDDTTIRIDSTGTLEIKAPPIEEAYNWRHGQDWAPDGSDFRSSADGKRAEECYGYKDYSAGTGELQITLTWTGNVDVDIWVTDPNGEKVYFAHRKSQSGGSLDRDNLCRVKPGLSENIFWEDAPPGEYKVQVNYFTACDKHKPDAYWKVNIFNRQEGKWRKYQGVLKYRETQDVTTITIND